MPWNPGIYNQFKNVRYQPFFDLLAMISDENLRRCVDIGCGTGEQTGILSEKFDKATFLGIDPSEEMLDRSTAFLHSRLSFKKATVEEFIEQEQQGKWDLVFSNAALQWSNEHEILFPQLISLLSDKGQLAVQMPVQNENLLNILLLELVQEKPFINFLDGWKRDSPLLTIDRYAQVLFENGLQDIQLSQKVYPIIASSTEELFNFIAGSSLIPYMERLSDSQQEIFAAEFRKRIGIAFKKFPAIYAFKRLLLYGRKN